jgi:hypothetical protein
MSSIITRELSSNWRSNQKNQIKMSKIVQFGEEVEGFNIRVLNEREIRAAAGILFFAVFLSLMFIMFEGNFVPVKYVLTAFVTDFLIRIFINPKYAPILTIARLIVRNQNPEYVGAQQKKVAWIIGLVFSVTMFVLLVVVNSYGYITGIVCLLCLILMFFETAFGICLGCKLYSLFYREKAQYCPGEICDLKSKTEIQKTSFIQIAIVLLFMAFLFTIAQFFNNKFHEKPYDMFARQETEKIN